MNTYKPSGKFSLLSILYLGVASITIIPFFAWLYAKATIGLLSVGVVFYYLNFIVTLIFGVLVGALVMDKAVVEWGKVRNVTAATLLGLVAGSVAYYWQWIFWLQARYYTEDTVVTLVTYPAAVFAAVGDLLATGTFTLEKNVVNGFWLFLIWLIEAALILFSTTFLPRLRASKPFSEKRKKWAKEIKLSPFHYIEPEEAEKLKAGDFTSLLSLQAASEQSHHSTVTLYDSYDDVWYVSIEDHFGTEDKKGKVKFEEIKLLEYVQVDATVAKYLQNPDTPMLASDAPVNQESNGKQQDAYHQLYDTQKTKIVVELLTVPPNQRNDDWDKQFYDNILQASFTCGNPQVVQGPDGLPYFMLQYPESKKPFNPFSLISIKDHVLKNGFGVALSPDGQQVIWSIPHGAMVNLHLNGKLFTQADHTNLPEREVLKEKTEVFYGQPSEEHLPATTREVLKDFLQTQGIAEPKMALMMRERPEGPSLELVFNIHAEEFESEQQFEALMKMVQWFLPRHYVITVLPKKPEYIEHLQPL
ncbi:MAG: hypothetical protein JNJ65_16280 [Cyclobacteriaceae bacterium]|nr:hypothetical protein [Cyclobacteriaceae bacterium]